MCERRKKEQLNGFLQVSLLQLFLITWNGYDRWLVPGAVIFYLFFPFWGTGITGEGAFIIHPWSPLRCQQAVSRSSSLHSSSEGTSTEGVPGFRFSNHEGLAIYSQVRMMKRTVEVRVIPCAGCLYPSCSNYGIGKCRWSSQNKWPVEWWHS